MKELTKDPNQKENSTEQAELIESAKNAVSSGSLLDELNSELERPPKGPELNELRELRRVIKIVEILRDPVRGCPWDIKQTHHSLLKHLIEESYEFVAAVENDNIHNMKEELGDVLLQVLLHSTIAKEKNKFNLQLVAKELAEKLIYRHQHVFAEDRSQNPDMKAEEALERWNIQKQKKLQQSFKQSDNSADNNVNNRTDNEKSENRKDNSVKGDKSEDTLSRNNSSTTSPSKQENEGPINEKLLLFPSLYSAYKIGKKSAEIKFDWDHYSQVMEKVDEELSELKESLKKEGGVGPHSKEEIGDLMFTVAQLARHMGLEPEETLRQANRKFIHRFELMEKLIMADHAAENKALPFNKIDLVTKESYWQKAKYIQAQKKRTYHLKPQYKMLDASNRIYKSPLPVIGLTGGVAAGKSTVGNILQSDYNLPVISGDKLVKKIWSTTKSYEFLCKNFPRFINKGPLQDSLNDIYQINFSLLRKEFFSSQASKELIENYIQPQIPAEFHLALQEITQFQSISFIIYEYPIIFEQNLANQFEVIICVSAEEAIQIKRLQKRDSADLQVAHAMLKEQLPLSEKKKLANLVIENNGSLCELKNKIESLVKELFN